LSALTVAEDESSIASSAGATVVPGLAVVADGNASALTVEDESVGTLQADLSVPVPGTAAEI
jgi:hypothetical protein